MAQTEPQSLATTALSILNEQTPQEQLYPHLLSDLRNETAMDKIRGFLEIFPFEQLSFARIELFSKLISMIALLLMLRRT